MAGYVLRNHTLLLQYAGYGSAHGEDSGLSVLRHLQLIVGPFKTQLREREAEHVIGFLEGVAGDRVKSRQLFSHARCLRSLSRKEKSDRRLAHAWLFCSSFDPHTGKLLFDACVDTRFMELFSHADGVLDGVGVGASMTHDGD